MKRNGRTIMTRFIILVKPLTGMMILAISLGLVGHLMATFISIFAAYALLNLLNFNEIPLHILFILMILFALLRGIFRYGEQASNHFIAFKLLALLRDQIFSKLRQLAPAKLEGKDKGNLINLITNDIELLEVFYAHTISPIAIAILFGICMMSFIAYYDIRLSILAFLAYSFIGFILPFLTHRASKDNGIQYRQLSADLSSYVLETLHGMDEILQFNQKQQRLELLNTKTKQLLNIESKMKSILGFNTAFTNTIIFIFDILMLLLSLQITNFPSAVLITIAFISSFGPFVSLSTLGSTLQTTFAAGNRLLDILDETPQVEENTQGEDFTFNGISVSHINFTYDHENILDDLSFSIQPNQILGIQGKSGCGKSTLLRLFMRFWDVKNGSINFEHLNIQDINTKSLRDNESFMTQDTHLFHDSIKNNLKIAKLDASDEEIIQACKKASIHDFILSLKDGYETQVSELGQSLSAGERQRIGLARVFLHNAPFMLLDEPTSNLDSLNEAIILKSIYEQKQDKTIVLVSHKTSTLKIADTLLKLDQGRVS